MMRQVHFLSMLIVLLLAGCSASGNDNAHTTATRFVPPPPTQMLTLTDRPEWLNVMLTRSKSARPLITILSPQPNQEINGDTVQVRLSVSGLLESYAIQSQNVAGVVLSADHIHV